MSEQKETKNMKNAAEAQAPEQNTTEPAAKQNDDCLLYTSGNLLMQMGDKDGAGKDMKRYLELNPEKVGELTGEFKAEGREHCR